MATTTTCTSCSRALRIPDELMGQQVKCPACGKTFTAQGDEAPPRREPVRDTDRRREPDREPDRRPSDRVARRDDDDRPRRRHEEDDDRPRRRRDEDDDDDYDRGRRRGRRRGMEEHRGTLVLVLGIIGMSGLVTGFTYLAGPVAWILGAADLRAMREGRMDPEGESNTRIGMILGIVSSCLLVLGILLVCMWFVFIASLIGASTPR